VIVQVLVGCAVGLVVAWVALALVLLAFRPPGQSFHDLAKVFPNSLRLAVALYRDPALPRSVRWRLRIAIIYNLQPINLIPDFIPVIGFADNAIVLIWALRSAIRVAGADAVARHWPGTPEGLAVVYRATRLASPHAGEP
jgi:uncharacterized membrane protein YkvA (DUF1232 family)